MLRIGTCLVLCLCCAFFAVPEVRVEDEDARLTQFFQKYLDELFHQRPLVATRLGDHRFDHLLDDVSPAARAGWTAHLRKTLSELPRRDGLSKLTRNGQMDFEIFKQDLTRSIWLAENTRPFEQDPRVYNEYITDSVYLLLMQSTLPKPSTSGTAPPA